jgi:hypothetical protein
MEHCLELGPHETDLIGNWLDQMGRLVSDGVDLRIGRLIADQLQKIAVNQETGAWETLYRDPQDGRYWELTFPKGGMHGGGPRRLTHIAAAVATRKYRLRGEND